MQRAAAWLAAPLAAVLVCASLGVARVEEGSMRPGLEPGDRIVFDRVSEAGRGDVVVVRDPGSWADADDALLVKRVVAVGGDRVACCEVSTGRLLVNGEPLDEPYAADAERPGGRVPFDVTVPAGSLWLVGDDRAASHDSRLEPGTLGAVPTDAVVGVMRARLPW